MVCMEIPELLMSEITLLHATKKPALHGQAKAAFSESDVLAHTCDLSTVGVKSGRP